MNPKTLAIICFGVAAISAFVAWERYQNNVKAVEAAQRMMDSSPAGGMMQGMMEQMTGQSELKPTMPAISKYAIAFAILSTIGGFIFLAKKSTDSQINSASS
jgi:hypothetical protein